MKAKMSQPFTALQNSPGLYRPAKVVSDDDVLRLARDILAARCARGNALESPNDVRQHLMHELAGLEHEVFGALFLDNRHRLLMPLEILFRGTLNGAAVYPREIVKRALALNAAAIVLVHNHPSGVAEPSRQDETLTSRLKAAFESVDVRLLDHVVVGAGETVSFSERGLL
jgi:DNA repair protein RadC